MEMSKGVSLLRTAKSLLTGRTIHMVHTMYCAAVSDHSRSLLHCILNMSVVTCTLKTNPVFGIYSTYHILHVSFYSQKSSVTVDIEHVCCYMHVKTQTPFFLYMVHIMY